MPFEKKTEITKGRGIHLAVHIDGAKVATNLQICITYVFSICPKIATPIDMLQSVTSDMLARNVRLIVKQMSGRKEV